MMHGCEKSDLAIVAVKPANKAERSGAELVERRAGTEGHRRKQRWAIIVAHRRAGTTGTRNGRRHWRDDGSVILFSGRYPLPHKTNGKQDNHDGNEANMAVTDDDRRAMLVVIGCGIFSRIEIGAARQPRSAPENGPGGSLLLDSSRISRDEHRSFYRR